MRHHPPTDLAVHSQGENETLDNQLNDVWKTPEVEWIESRVEQWVKKHHMKGGDKGSSRKKAKYDDRKKPREIK